MGSARWNPEDWNNYSTTTKSKPTAAIFKSSSLKDDLNPFGIGVRESRDSILNPVSNAIIVGLDVTGSMGMIADNLARNGLGVMVEEILARKPVSDPHIMAMGIGDAYYDRAPLQVTQCDADIFGTNVALADAEILAVTYKIFSLVGLKDVTIQISSSDFYCANCIPPICIVRIGDRFFISILW